MKRIFAFIFLIVSLISAQTKDPIKIINSVIEKFEKIRDYEVDVTIKLDFSMVKIPDMKAKYYFKQPDKVKIDSKGFAMLPKQSLNFSPAQFLKGDFTAIYVKTETEDNHSYDIIKIIPNNDSSDVILSTLWVDQNQKIIKKIETTGKRSGTLHIELVYENDKSILPELVTFSFNTGNIPIRNGLPEKKEDKKDDRPNIRRDSQMSGKVYMTYSNYKINKGIPESFFEEKNNLPQK
jgi:outer membrane lipoprotein-sorting protein